MAMKVDETMLDGLTAQCKTPQDVAELYTQMLQWVIDRWRRSWKRTWAMAGSSSRRTARATTHATG